MKKLLAILHNDLYVEVICLSFFVIAFCYMPFENFIDGYVKILTNSAVLLQDFVYIGDDINDIACLEYAKYKITVPHALEKVKNFAEIQITDSDGGDGAFREVVDCLIG